MVVEAQSGLELVAKLRATSGIDNGHREEPRTSLLKMLIYVRAAADGEWEHRKRFFQGTETRPLNAEVERFWGRAANILTRVLKKHPNIAPRDFCNFILATADGKSHSAECLSDRGMYFKIWCQGSALEAILLSKGYIQKFADRIKSQKWLGNIPHLKLFGSLPIEDLQPTNPIMVITDPRAYRKLIALVVMQRLQKLGVGLFDETLSKAKADPDFAKWLNIYIEKVPGLKSFARELIP